MKKINRFLLAAVVFAGLTTSCEIGLGPAVDVEQPSMTIVLPEVGGVAGTNFSITGTCIDDARVDRVVLKEIRSSDDEDLKYSFDTETDPVTAQMTDAKNTSWKLPFTKLEGSNYSCQGKKMFLPDGTYIVDFIAYDETGKPSGDVTRAFDIDNTPPVFLIENPGEVEGGASPSDYGRTVTIAGQISDAHTVTDMDIRVYRLVDGSYVEITDKLSKTNFRGFDDANASVVIARYVAAKDDLDQDSKILRENYLAMFGIDRNSDFEDVSKVGNQEILVSLKLTDKAGNVSENSYISSLIKEYMSKNAGLDGNDTLTATDYSKVLSDTSTLEDATKEIVLAALMGDGSDPNMDYLVRDNNKGQNRLRMSLNPNSSPSYTVSTQVDLKNGEYVWPQVTQSTTLTVQVKAGLEGGEFVPSTLALHVYECFENNSGIFDGTYAPVDEMISFSKDENKEYFKKNETESAFDDDNYCIQANYILTFPNIFPNGKSFRGNGRYVVVLEGKDRFDNEIVPTALFGFHVESSGAAPVVEPDDEWNENFKDKGYVKDVNEFVKLSSVGKSDGFPSYGLLIRDSETNNISKFGDNAVAYEVRYYKGFHDKNLVSDKGKIDSIEPVLEWKDGIAGNKLTSSAPQEFKTQIPLRPFVTPENETYTIVMSMKARNSVSDPDNTVIVFYADNSAPEFNIDNNITDGAIINSQSEGFVKEVADNGIDFKYSYQFEGIWSDVNGSGTMTLQYKEKSSDDWSDVPAKDTPQGTASSRWRYSLPLTEGNGKNIWFRAVDKVGNISAEQKILNITCDYIAPTLRKTSPGVVEKYYNSDLVLEFEANDSYLVKDIVVSAKKNGETVSIADRVKFTKPTAIGGKATSVVTLKAEDGAKWEISIQAVDEGGQKSETLEYSTTIEKVSPVIKSILIDDNEYAETLWYKNLNLRVKGKVQEALSGLDRMDYVVTRSNNSTIKSTSELAKISATDGIVVGSVSASGAGEDVEFSMAPNGLEENVDGIANALWIQAVDKAGNRSEAKKYIVKIDQTPSESSAKFYSINGKVLKIDGTVLSNKENDVVIYGTVEENQSGTESVKLQINGSDIAAITYGTATKTVAATDFTSIGYKDISSFSDRTKINVWKAVIAKDNIKDGDVKIVTTDVAGNENTQAAFIISVDTEKPTISLVQPLDKSSVNGTKTIAGSSSDNASLESVTAVYWTDNNKTKKPLGEKSREDAFNWKFENLAMTKKMTGGFQFIDGTTYNGATEKMYVEVTALDTAGNSDKAEFTFILDPDSDRSIITINSISIDKGAVDDTKPMDLSSNYIWLKDTSTLSGIVTDDDDADGNSTLECKIDSGNWQPVELLNGSWSLDLGDDGPKKVYFRVKDCHDGVFESNAAGGFGTPKLLGGNGNDANGVSVLNLRVDTVPPTLTDPEYQSFNGLEWGSFDENNTWTRNTWSKVYTANAFGGKYTKMKIRAQAEDGNGVASVKMMGLAGGEDIEFNESSVRGDVGKYWISNEISLDSTNAPTNSYTCSVKALDNAGMNMEKSISFYVDNTDPEITISSPVNGGTIASAFTAYGTVDEAGAEVYFAITDSTKTDSSKISGSVQGAELAANKWQKINDATLSWTIYFDGDTDVATTHTDSIDWYMTKDRGVGKMTREELLKSESDDTSFNMIMHIKAVDKNGNTGYKSVAIVGDTSLTKPSVEIISPKHDSTLGGSVMIMGTANDDEEPNYVWLMLDVNGDGVWNYDDIKYINEKVGSEYEFGHYDPKAVSEDDKFKPIAIGSIPRTGADYAYYAIRCPVNGSSWSFTFNENDKFTKPSEPVKINVFAYATDKKGNHSTMSPDKMLVQTAKVSFIIDGDAPRIENQYLRKYEGGKVAVQKIYTDGMAISGEWYYEADIFDDTGIDYVKIDNTEVSQYDLSPVLENAPANVSGYHLKKLVGKNDTSSVENISFEIEFAEKKENPIEKTVPISFKLDNKKPDITDTTKLSLNKDNKRWVNNNGFFTFGGTVSEPISGKISQTGATKVAFYITDKAGTKVYDIMKKNVANDYVSGDVVDGLVWKKTTATANGTSTISVADSDFAKTGGLAKINGLIYCVASVNGKSVTLETTPGEVFESSSLDVSFALASVVDNPIQESEKSMDNPKNSDGYFDSQYLNFDDGDGMVEGFIKNGTSWNWSATVNTKVLSDGVYVLHYVVFDAAGNTNHQSDEIFIGNNQPRVVGVTVATDDDNNGVYSENETYSAASRFYTKDTGKGGAGTGLDAVGKVVTEATFPVASTDASPKQIFTVKNGLKIQPETVGGNGDLKYSFEVFQRNGGNNGWSTTVTGKSSLENPLKLSDGTQAVGNDLETNLDDVVAGSITLDPWILVNSGIKNGKNQKFALKILDSTEGQSMYAQMNLILGFEIHDNEEPLTKIIPFYWNSADDNSLFEESSQNGHIELPQYITSGMGSSKNPRVSGKIKVEGVAQDNIQLKTITLKIGSKTCDLAEYKNIDGEWKWVPNGANDGISASITQATYGQLDKSSASDIKNALVPYFSQEYGHVVKWTAVVDTEKLMSVGSAVTMVASATDRGSPKGSVGEYDTSNTSSADSSQTGGTLGNEDYTNRYTVEAVPYISGLLTSLSRINEEDLTVYGRSSSGKYAVRAPTFKNANDDLNPRKDENGETVVIKGFNLSGAEVYLNNGTKISSTSGTDGISIVAKDLKNGKIYVQNGSVKSVNNINDNNAPYNIIDNDQNNHHLDDDIEVQLWEFKNMALKTTDNLQYATVKVNPNNGILGASFGNMNFYNMPGYNVNEQTGTTDWSQDKWHSQTPFMWGVNGCDEGTFAFDSNGVSYGTISYQSSDGDAHSNTNGAFHFIMKEANYVPHTTSSIGGSYGRFPSFGLRLESNSIPILKAPGTIEPVPTGGTNNNSKAAIDKYANPHRVTSSTIVANSKVGDTSSTRVYIAYADTTTNQIRLRVGEINPGQFEIPLNKNLNKKGANTSYTMEEGTFKKIKDYADVATDTTIVGLKKVKDENNKDINVISDYHFLHSVANFTGRGLSSDKADGSHGHDKGYKYPYTDETTDVTGKYATDSLANMAYQTVHVIAATDVTTDAEQLYRKATYGENGFGKYCSLAVKSDDSVAVVVWYDADADKLKFAWNTKAQLDDADNRISEMLSDHTHLKEPEDENGVPTMELKFTSYGEMKNSFLPKVQATSQVWQSQTKEVSQSGGSYVKAAMVDNVLHLAYVDDGIKYAYSVWDGTTFSNPVVMTVDSFNAGGTNLTLEVGKDSDGNHVPFISYYYGGRAKYATCLAFENNLPKGDGCDDEGMYSGDWDITFVPSSSGVSKSTVNVAVRLDENKMIGSIATDLKDIAKKIDNPSGSNRNPGYSSTVYGNGSENPVVGYITSAGNLEIAQIVKD